MFEALTDPRVRPTEAPPEECPDCEGRGWVLSADHGAGVARRCDCHKRQRQRQLVDASGIPTQYRSCSLKSFQPHDSDPGVTDQLMAAVDACRRYVDGFLQEDGTFRYTGLLFVGPPGVGKTHLAVAVLLEIVKRFGRHGRFVDFTNLIQDIQATFDSSSRESQRDVLDPVVGADILVLDELGAQKPTAWVQDILYYVINTRYTERRPTLFTTNYVLEKTRRPDSRSLDRGPDPSEPVLGRQIALDERVQARLISRLYEMAQPVIIDSAPDFRRLVQSRSTAQR